MKRKTRPDRAQVLVEYILLTVLLLGATVIVLRFMIQDVFKGSLPLLKDKTTQCVSRLPDGKCQ